ncbi:MAG: hypothetical protein ABR592_07210 [Nitriliruptorales bacterium]
MTTPSGALAVAPGSGPPEGVSQPAGGHSRRPSAVNEDTDGDGVANCPDPSGDADNRHPSGRDRHCEAGGSGVQGRSESDPDGDTNGGADKPGGAGGRDVLDQDGNNGCGNDDDFEDDNKGRCLGRLREQDGSPPPTGAPSQEQPDRTVPDETFGKVVSSPFNWQAITADTQRLVLTEELAQERSTTGGTAAPATFAAASAGNSRTGGSAPARLASTGASLGVLAIAAFLALLAGLGLRSASRRVGRSQRA